MRLVLFVTAFALALGVTAALGRFSAPEHWEYSDIARNVLAGRGWYYDYFGARYHFYGPPLYPGLLVVALALGDAGVTLVLVLQAAALAATALIVAHVARPVAGQTAALVAGALVATHPGALIYAGKLHPQTFDVLLIALAFVLMLRIDCESRASAALGFGAVAGLAVLSRGPLGPFFVAWGIWLLWRERRRWRRTLRIVLLVTVGGTVVVAPVVVRGYALYGELVSLRTDTGVNLWYGNHPGATGTSYTRDTPPVPVHTQIPPELTSALVDKNELVQNRLFLEAATRFMREEPGEAARLFARKLGYFWWFSPAAGLLYPALWTALYMAYYIVILGGAVVGLDAALRSSRPVARWAAGFFLLLAVTLSLTQAAFYVEGRHRWQLELILLAFTAAGIVKLSTGEPTASTPV